MLIPPLPPGATWQLLFKHGTCNSKESSCFEKFEGEPVNGDFERDGQLLQQRETEEERKMKREALKKVGRCQAHTPAARGQVMKLFSAGYH